MIFLGDYFDNFGDNVSDARLTASWLRKRMDSTDDVLLLGNHDAAYLFPKLDALYCPGFTKAKARAIHEVLQPKHWQRFKLAHVEQGWLLSHAGLNRCQCFGVRILWIALAFALVKPGQYRASSFGNR